MYIKLLIAVLALNMIACFEPGHAKETYIFKKFKNFMVENNRNYPTIEEFQSRFQIFKNNYVKLEKFAASQEEFGMKVGVTMFFDMTETEFKENYANLKVNNALITGDNVETDFEFTGPVKASIDWRKEGVDGPVKDQGGCGSCWAFSTVGNLEGLYAIKHKKNINLSEQELVDCDLKNHGCSGGFMTVALNYVKDANGLAESSSYPYKAKRAVCRAKQMTKLAAITAYRSIRKITEEKLIQLLQDGPVSVAINATPLKSYRGGVFKDPNGRCSPKGLNHAVTLVGYTDTEYIIKNSWGTRWGEKGYFRFARGSNICGILEDVVSAVLA